MLVYGLVVHKIIKARGKQCLNTRTDSRPARDASLFNHRIAKACSAYLAARSSGSGNLPHDIHAYVDKLVTPTGPDCAVSSQSSTTAPHSFSTLEATCGRVGALHRAGTSNFSIKWNDERLSLSPSPNIVSATWNLSWTLREGVHFNSQRYMVC